MRRSAYILLNLALVAALAFVIWLIIDRLQGAQPRVAFEVVAQDDISRQLPDSGLKLLRLIFNITRGEGVAAVKDYLKQHGKEGFDAYNIISNRGIFMVIGERLGSELAKVPQEVQRVLGPCRAAKRVAREGSYQIYQCGS